MRGARLAAPATFWIGELMLTNSSRHHALPTFSRNGCFSVSLSLPTALTPSTSKLFETTNWKSANEEYDREFDLMWKSRSDYPVIFLLKPLNRHFLAVEVNPCCIMPRDPLHDSLEAYGIIHSNLTSILGIRYHTDGATKEMVIAPFGRFLYFLHILRIVDWLKNIGQILFCTHSEASGFPWTASEYALVLEIRGDGGAGDLLYL